MRARYMDPSTGRFLSMDTYQGSIWEPNSLHKYTYTSGNPVMYQDVSGYSASAIDVTTATKIQQTLSWSLNDEVALRIFSNVVRSMSTFSLYITETVKNTMIGTQEDFRNNILIFVLPDYTWNILVGEPLEDIFPWIEILTVPQQDGITILGTDVIDNSNIWDNIVFDENEEYDVDENEETDVLEQIYELIKGGEIKDNNIISRIDDDSQIIFRKDTGDHAHSIKSRGYDDVVEHYNIEIQTKTLGGKWKRRWSYHIIIDILGNIIDVF